MSIQVGTHCYLTGDHLFAGKCCTVVSGLQECRIDSPTGRRCNAYVVDIPNAPAPWLAPVWGAEPRHLIPIAPPPGWSVFSDGIAETIADTFHVPAKMLRP